MKNLKKSKGSIIRNVRYLFRLKKEYETIKDRIIRIIKNIFEQEENYYKSLRVVNFYHNN